MRYLINGRSFTFDEEDLESIKLDEGTEGSCYRVHNYYDDFVMKIHHDKPEKKILDEKQKDLYYQMISYMMKMVII